MEITRRLPGELQPLDSGLTAMQSRPFKPWGGNPSGPWHYLQSKFCLIVGRVDFILSWVLQNLV